MPIIRKAEVLARRNKLNAKAQLKQAYPKAVKDLDKRRDNYMLKTDPNIYIAPACRR